MWQIIPFVVIVPLVLWIFYWYYWITYFERYLNKLPGPPLVPIFGNALDFANPIEILPNLMNLFKQFNRNFKGYLGTYPFLLICDPKGLEPILNSTTIIKKSWNYKFFHNWLGFGLLTSTGNKWKKHRKILTPAFHFQMLEEFIDVFNSASNILVSKLEIESRKSFVDIYPFVARCTLDIICESAMGTSINAQSDYKSEYVQSVNELLEIVVKRSISPILINGFIYRFSGTFRRERKALKVVQDYTKFVLNNRKEKFVNDGKKRRAFLDLMLDYSFHDPSFTEDDICQEINTFMFEGYDTTATSIAFILYSLSSYPDVQKKAFDEQQIIFSDDPNRDPTYKDLQDMKYLEMVIKESLRIYTTVPLYGRTLEEDIVWNDLHLPKGLMLIVFAYCVHHSNIYDNPELFNPERFNPQNAQGRHPFAYIPFSAGPRNCIGQKFAMLEMKSTVSKVLRSFELLPTNPQHKVILKAECVLKSHNGVIMKLKRRS